MNESVQEDIEEGLHAFHTQEIVTAFTELACDDRDILCDVKHAPTYLADMNKVWTGKLNNYDVADDYFTELARSASMYTEPPTVHTVQEIKVAAYQVKCNRVHTDDIIELEVPFLFTQRS